MTVFPSSLALLPVGEGNLKPLSHRERGWGFGGEFVRPVARPSDGTGLQASTRTASEGAALIMRKSYLNNYDVYDVKGGSCGGNCICCAAKV